MRCAFGSGERHDCAWLVCALLIAVAVRVTPVSARGTPPAADPPPLTAQQLEQLVAPIALYPDDLLSQVLMASTYPLEVVQAARWASQNASVTVCPQELYARATSTAVEAPECTGPQPE